MELPDLGTVDEGHTLDGDAGADRWVNADHDNQSARVPPEWVTRIARAESSWQDPYDLDATESPEGPGGARRDN